MAVISNTVFWFALLVGFVSTNEWRWGRCPPPPVNRNFNISKFQGKWYVNERAGSIFRFGYPSCQVSQYQVKSPSKVELIESLEYGPLLQELFNTKDETITLTIPNPSGSNCMRETDKKIYKSLVCVIDSDYDSYAAVYECQNYGYMHKQCGTILSRNLELNLTIKGVLKGKMAVFDIPDKDFRVVDHSDCAFQADKSAQTNKSADITNKEQPLLTEELVSAIALGDFPTAVTPTSDIEEDYQPTNYEYVDSL